MRENHGWVPLRTDSILLGLDSYQFHFYQIARLICNPPNAKEEPGLLDLREQGFSEQTFATVLRCSRRTLIRVRRELIDMGLLRQEGRKLYVVEPKLQSLHNCKLVFEEAYRFLQASPQHGVATQFNAHPRRSGARQGGKTAPPSHSSANTPTAQHCAAQSQSCAAQSHFPGAVAPPSHSPVPPSHISGAANKVVRRRKEEVPKKIRSKGTEVPKNLPAWKKRLAAATEDPLGVVSAAFESLHPDAPTEDMAEARARLAAIAREASYDWGYLLLLIWRTSSMPVTGSHLNYIHACVRKERPAAEGERSFEEDARYWDEVKRKTLATRAWEEQYEKELQEKGEQTSNLEENQG